jgi:hypothetical protein
MSVHLRTRILLLLGSVALMFASLVVSPGLSAQSGTQDIYIWTYENDGSGSSTDACYVLLGYSQEGCDLNGDGAVLFEDVAYGTYTVRQTADLGAGRYVNDFTITVSGAVPDFVAFIITEGVDVPGSDGPSRPQSGTRDLYIATVANDASYYDACYVLVGYSQEGCDDNRDGYVLFEDVAYGIYVVEQTADITPWWIRNFTIEFTADTDNVFYAVLNPVPANPANVPPAPTATDLSLLTRDPDSGDLLTGACYQLVGFSNVGCDENSDGQVDFADIPHGTYIVRQMTAPDGYGRIDDFPIEVRYAKDYFSLVVKQEETQSDGTTDNVSLIFLDAVTNERVAGDNICVSLEDQTQIGCDEAPVDGQIDFLDVPHGHYDLEWSGDVYPLEIGTRTYVPSGNGWIDSWGNDELPNTVIYIFLTPTD